MVASIFLNLNSNPRPFHSVSGGKDSGERVMGESMPPEGEEGFLSMLKRKLFG